MVRFIALCGYPKAGKSEVQKIITQRYGLASVDDSRPLRDAAMHLYGLSEWHVSTQEGKSTLIRIGDEEVPVRKLMGDLGDYLETRDPFHFPRLAVATCRARRDSHAFVFASVRKNQPLFFRDTGEALIIEVTRQGCAPLAPFDEYERSCIDFTIPNEVNPDAPVASRHALERAVAEMLDPILPRLAETSAA